MQKLYIAIKDDLLAKIESGTYALGQTIPTELELAEAYGVSRPTVRQALQLLVEAGYLDRRKRRGTIVCDPRAREVGARPAADDDDADSLLAPLGVAERVVDSVEQAAESRVRTQCLLAHTMPATREVARNMGIKAGDEVYKIVRLRYLDGQPNVFMVTFVPVVEYPGLLDVDLSHHRLYPRMAEVGRPVATATRRLEVAKADIPLSAILDVPMDDPLFLFYITGRDADGAIVEFSVTYYRGRDNSIEFSTDHEA